MIMNTINWDRFIGAPFDDGFDDWCDEVIEGFSDKFYKANEDWIIEGDGQFNEWANELFYKRDKLPKEAAVIIERAHGLYCGKKVK